MTNADKIAYGLCSAYIIIGLFYLWEHDWAKFHFLERHTYPWKAMYWLSASLINLSVTNMGVR